VKKSVVLQQVARFNRLKIFQKKKKKKKKKKKNKMWGWVLVF
jgi:hypothetical protein